MRKYKKIVMSFIIVILLAGAGGYGYIFHVKAVKADEEKRIEEKIVRNAEEGMNKLYSNEKKEALAEDLSKQQIDDTLAKVKLIKDDKIKASMEKEIHNMLILFHFQKELGELLEKGVLVSNVKLSQITFLNKDFEQVKEINSRIASSFNRDVQLINTQFNTIQTVKKKVQSLFSNYQKLSVKADITESQYTSAMKMVGLIKNTQTKNKLVSQLDKVKSALVAKQRKEAEVKTADKDDSRKQTSTSEVRKPQSASKQIKRETGLASIVAYSNTAKKTDQIVAVVASGTSAQITLLEKRNGTWEKVITTSGHVGSQGVGTASESLSRTPKGSYSLGFAFGTSNPGTSLPFRKITPHSYWISNVKDAQYNTWQERTSSSKYDEHLADYPVQYHYAIVINYHNGVGGGSGFFLHCDNGRPTAGCVSVPTSVMAQFMKSIHSGAYIINVTSESSIANY